MILSRLFPGRGAATAITKARDAQRVESKAVHLSYPAERFWLDGNPVYDRDHRSVGPKTAFRQVALVYACMLYRATKLSEAPVWIAEEDADGESFLEGEHELSAVLERPNPDMSMSELLELLSLYDDATGGWLLVKNEDRANRVASMYPYAFDEFSVRPANGRLYGVFGVQTLTGYREFGPDRVIFRKRAALGSLLETTAPMHAALAHINIGDKMRLAIASMLRRAIRPGAKVEVPGNYGDDQARRLKADFEALFSGVENAGRVAVVEGGAAMEMLQVGLKDLELGPVQGDVEAAICQCFQVHPALVSARIGLENSSGFADLLASATEATYDNAFLPTWSRYEEKFTLGLLRPIDEDPRRFIRFDKTKVKALQTDMTARTTEAKQAVGYWLIDEQRAHTGKPPLPNGEGQVLSKPASPAKPGGDDETDADGKPKTKSAFASRSLRAVTGAAIATISLSAAWQDFDAKAQAQEQRYHAAAVAQFERERDGVITIVEQSVPSHKADVPDEEQLRRIATAALIAPYLETALLRIAAHYDANGVFRGEWVTRFMPLVRQTMREGAQDVAAAIGVDFNVSNPRVTAAIQARVTKLAGEVTDTSLQRVRDVIATAREEGVGVSEISKRIREDAFGGTITKTRATTIARTETVGALNEGEHLAAIESGVMQSKRWLTQGDGRVRDSHKGAGAEGWIPIAQRYTNGLDYPHQPYAPAEEVIHCRCAQLFSDLTADEANRGQT